MKRTVSAAMLVVTVILVAISAFRTIHIPARLLVQPKATTSYTDQDIISCGPAGKPLAPLNESGRMMVPLPGWGNHTWKVNTANDSALFFFNQGLNLFYSFHMAESKSSFQEAQRHDSTFAMAYWGQAMASGPFINSTGYRFDDPAIIAALTKAAQLATDPLEKALINAQQKRFTADKGATRPQLFATYRDEMKSIYDAHAGNVEVAVLYADATMMVNARNWYTLQGDAKAGTDDIIALLEQIIEKNPAHPAALHYYIHVVEPSHTPGRALAASDKLLYLMPSVTHMVHMPSHIYVRTGDYKKGVLSNVLAIEGYDRYKEVISNGWEGNLNLYVYHNVDMQGTNALLMGNYAEARKAFQQNVDRFNKKDKASFADPGFGDYLQFVTAQPYLLNVQFGKWKTLLAAKQPQSNNLSHKIYWQFGRGMALAKTKQLPAARTALRAIKEMMKDSLLNHRMGNRSRTIDIVTIPMHILEGTIALAEKKGANAIHSFKNAVQAEDTLRYAEPESWRMPARHFLGQAYLQTGDYANAQQVFEVDLADHPNNFWSVNGLKQALLKQHKDAELAEWQKKYKTVLTLADAAPGGATF